MTMFEYIKKAYHDMKDKPPKERLEYFMDYYKWPALAVVLVIIITISSIVAIANRKEDVLFGELLNCSTLVEDVTYMDDFYAVAEIDAKECSISLSTDLSFVETGTGTAYEAHQMMVAIVAAKRVDFFVGADHSFQNCAYNSSRVLADLRNIMDAETLEKWSDRIYYIDGDVVEQIRNYNNTMTVPEFPDPHDPESMVDPIPVAIDISDCTAFRETYYPLDQVLYLGIAINAPHPETTLQFIDYLFTK